MTVYDTGGHEGRGHVAAEPGGVPAAPAGPPPGTGPPFAALTHRHGRPLDQLSPQPNGQLLRGRPQHDLRPLASAGQTCIPADPVKLENRVTDGQVACECCD